MNRHACSGRGRNKATGLDPAPLRLRRCAGVLAPFQRRLPSYRKILDRRFDFGEDAPGITLRVRILQPRVRQMHPLTRETRIPSLILLCWTVRQNGTPREAKWQQWLGDPIRKEIVTISSPLLLFERFIYRIEESRVTAELDDKTESQERGHTA